MNERMKGMKLGNFSGIKKPQPEPTKPPEPEVTEPEIKPIETKPEPVKTTKSKAKVGKKTKSKQKQEQLVTVNIKIKKSQKEWLTDTASQVRENNTEPVPPSQRVYPQHLIGVAIDLLQNVNVDWGEVKNLEELREYLNL